MHNISVRKAKILSLCALLFILIAGIIAAVCFLKPPQIVINEICSANDGENPTASDITDVYGDLCDWIELYNPTDKDISLKGFSLRINGGEQQALGDYTVKSGDYLLIYCSKNEISEDVPQARFNIPKAENSEIELDYGFSVCDRISVCKIEKGNSYSKNYDGEMYVSSPTPLLANSAEVIGCTPAFSHTAGFYSDEFELEIYATEGQTVYYTLDGTDPTSSDTRIEYTGAITVSDRNGEPNTISAYDPMKIQLDYREGSISAPKDEDVDKGTVVRACAKSADGKYGKVSTAAYFVGLSTADHNDLPVVSIVTDPENLYDEETGIYCMGEVYEEYAEEHPNHYHNGSIPANYNQKGREWERECYIEFFESDGSLKLSQDAGMRIQGGWSRADYQKSFRFYARSDYGKNSFDYAFWEGLTDSGGNEMNSFKTLVLRNGGNDTNYSKFKDTMIQNMVSEKNFATQAGRACILFIDGEYWGLYTLQEDYTEEYFADHYGVVETDVALVKRIVELAEETDDPDFNEMREFITQNDMSAEENYRKAESLMDMDNFAEYMAIECYIYNDDWPQNNYGCWRVRQVQTDNPYADGRWRFYLFDTESSAYHYNTKSDETDIFTYLEKQKETALGGIIHSLLRNGEFRQKFITALMDMRNTSFEYGRYKEYLAEYKSVYYDELDNYYKRFPTWANKKNAVDSMLGRMSDFFYTRPERITKLLETEFELSDRRKISLRSDDAARGKVLVNGSEVRTDFSGTYFDGCTLTVEAVPEKGYIFTGWYDSKGELYSGSPEIEFTVKGNLKLTAEFERSIL
ncbi:MAG: CotH kinase family protein [Ruminococcus sp.]|nr:CotH kinase family protein [Ruminococcus sp.]